MRFFSFDRPTTCCDRRQCDQSSVVDTGGVRLPTPPSDAPRLYWPAEQRHEYDEAVHAAFRALYAAPLPQGWLKIVGGGQFNDREYDPELCSLRCARLWITAREREGGHPAHH